VIDGKYYDEGEHLSTQNFGPGGITMREIGGKGAGRGKSHLNRRKGTKLKVSGRYTDIIGIVSTITHLRALLWDMSD